MSTSEETLSPPISEAAKKVLAEVKRHAFLQREETLFSIAGRGYYENATSDLLAYFMRPNGQHGFGPLFLRTFFDCMGKKGCDVVFKDVRVWRESPTKDGGRIDLLVTAPDWVLVIENKIHHWLANDLVSYEAHAKRQSQGRTVYLAILSPDGVSALNWTPVTYRNYCYALKSALQKTFFDSALSKWQVFAREFILHLESEICDARMTMTPDQIEFVEKHLLELEEAKAFRDGYILFLEKELQERLRGVVPARQCEFRDNWGLLCHESVGHLHLQFLFQTPSHKNGNDNRKFRIGVWVGGLTESERAAAQEVLADMEPPSDDSRGTWWIKCFACRDDAVNGLCKLAKQVFNLWDKPTSGLSPIEQ